jgi:uncharacterized protein (UPF0332 family)
MNGRAFLKAAEYLLKRKEEEVLRSAVSRSYYALFHESRDFLKELQIPCSRGPQAHGEVRSRLNNCGDQQMQEVSRLLAQLHKERLLADYDLDDKTLLDANTCVLLVKSAAIGIDYLDATRQSLTRCDLIRNSIREYERKIYGR